MRIERLSIDGFGHYAGAEFGPFNPGLVVLYGPNEAGKTTMLSFIHTVLFGFPRRNHVNAIPPLAGGRHGGRVILADSEGQQYIVSRHSDTNNGKAQVTMPNGSVRGEETLQYLLSHISRDLFQSIFAFGLDQLQTIDSLQGDEVSGRIYGAGLGTEKLPQTLAMFEKQAQDIFRPNGKLQPVAELLDELEVVEKKIAQTRAEASAYHDLLDERRTLDEHISQLEADIDARQREQAMITRLQSAWDDWVTLSTIETRFRELDPIDHFPENGLARLESLEAEYWAAEREFSQAEQAAQRASDLATAPVPDAPLRDYPEAIEGLRSERSSYERWIQELPDRRATIANLQHELNSALAELGTGWDEERLADFDVSIPARNSVQRMREQIATVDEERRTAEREVQSRAAELHEAEHQAERISERLAELPDSLPDNDTLRLRQDLIRRARDCWARLEMARQTYRDEEARLSTGDQQTRKVQQVPGWIPPALSLLGIGLFALGAILGGSALVIGVIAGVILLMLMIALLVINRRASSGNRAESEEQQRLQQARDAVNRANAEYVTAAEAVNIDPHAGPVALQSAETALDTSRQSAAERDRLREREREANEEEERRRERLNEAWEKLDQATQTRNEARRDWTAWLRSNGLQEDLSPDYVLELFTQLEQARSSREQLVQARKEWREIVADIRRYQQQLVPVLSAIGEPLPESSPHTIAAVIDDIIERYDDAREALARQAQYQEQADEEYAWLRQREREFEAAESRLSELLQAGGAHDAEIFRERGQIYEERRRLQAQRDEIMERLQRLSGPGDAWIQFRDRLNTTSAADLEQDAARLATQIPDLEANRDEQLRYRGELSERIRRLEGDTSGSELRAQRAELVEQLREHAREWTIYTVGKNILTRAQKKFEEERQPAVLRTAQDVLRTITDGRYTRISIPEGETRWVEVLEASGQRKRIEELSRGTREQLYLALRFGLIQEFGERAEPLPVVVDDIMVNFDPSRARAAGQCFVDLANTHQVMLFTCHPSTVEIFQNARPDTQIIEWSPHGHD